jgi:acetylornithine deacetylase/succinyl-diaminopimelate desuccinylase-like protein
MYKSDTFLNTDKGRCVLVCGLKPGYTGIMAEDNFQLLQAACGYQGGAVAFLQDLVRIPSVNGRDPEAQVARRVVEEAERLGLPARLVAADPQRPNVLVELGSGVGGFALIAHLDTVEEGDHGDWSHPPFGGEIHNGRLYGRGTADNKAGIACGLYTLALLRDQGLLDLSAARAVLAGVVDEESGANSRLGARYLLDQGHLDVSGAIYTYTGDKIRIGHRGVLRLRLRATGEAIHSGRRVWHQKKQGLNAGTALMAAALAIDRLEIPATPHPAFEGLGCTVTVTGFRCGPDNGAVSSIVPGWAEAGVDIRLMPGQSSDAVLEIVRGVVERSVPPGLGMATDVTVDIPAAVIPPDHPLVETAKRWTRTVTGKEWPVAGAGPANEGYMFIEAGIPTLCGFGPQGGNAHALDEYVEVGSLAKTLAMYAGIVCDYLGG